MTEPAESRQERFIQAGPPPSWLLPDSDDPVPQPVVEVTAIIADALSTTPLPKPWLDTPWILDPVKVKALGYAGINRYWCHDYNVDPSGPLPQKRVGYDELQRMIDAGLDFHWNGEDAASDFNKGYAFWHDTGQRMTDYADQVLKLPHGVGAFSSCDMDVGLQMNTVQLESQRGFRDGYQFGPAGIYGSSIAINNTMDAGTAKMGWLTVARYWSHGITPSLYHLDQDGSAFNGSADTNSVVTSPFGSLLQVSPAPAPTPLGGRMFEIIQDITAGRFYYYDGLTIVYLSAMSIVNELKASPLCTGVRQLDGAHFGQLRLAASAAQTALAHGIGSVLFPPAPPAP